MNNKGFTMIEILGVVVLLGILMSTAVIGVSIYKKKAEEDAVEIMANTAMNATKNYLIDHPSDDLNFVVSLNKLYNSGYMERPVDPSEENKMCIGEVEAIKISDSLKTYEYEVKVCCSLYSKLYKFPGNIVTDITCP